MYRKHLLTVWENENFHFWPTDRKRESERKRETERQTVGRKLLKCFSVLLGCGKIEIVAKCCRHHFYWFPLHTNLLLFGLICFLCISFCCSSCCFQLRQRKEGSKTLLSIIIYYCFVASFVHRRFVFSHFGIYFRSVWKNEKRKHWRRIQRKNEMRRRRAWAITFWDDWMKIAFISYWCHYARSRKKLSKSNQKEIHIYLI